MLYWGLSASMVSCQRAAYWKRRGVADKSVTSGVQCNCSALFGITKQKASLSQTFFLLAALDFEARARVFTCCRQAECTCVNFSFSLRQPEF